MAAETFLILGGQDDEHAVHVLSHLRERGHDTELLDSRAFPTELTISFDPKSKSGTLSLPGGRRLGYHAIRAVYWRTFYGAAAPVLPDPEQSFLAANDARSLLESLLASLPTKWVNGLRAFQLHQTKPVQLAIVASAGIPVPQTLVTNEAAALRKFAADHPRSIFKPVQGGAHARRLIERHLNDENLKNLTVAPVTVQEEIDGTNIRVFVAGDTVHACEIRTAALDFRDDPGCELHIHRLADEVVEQCRRVARLLDLLWTGMDWRLTPAGQYVFLEANPSPMFLGFERATGLPLTESLVTVITT